MRINIRLFRPMAYGNFTTVTFTDISAEDTLVCQLKRKINLRLRLETKD